MSLLVLMLALALCAAGVIAWPWLRKGRPVEQARRSANVAAYRTRVAEVEDEQRDQLVDEEAARELKDEAAARLLDDESGSAATDRRRQRGRRGWATGVVLALFPLVVGGAWYVRNGSWRVAQEVATDKPSLAIARQDVGDVKGMVDRLRTELKENPEDANRWALLGRSEMALGNYKEAVASYAQANQRTARSNPGWLV
ncbi:MAG TPA: c-type cytochrome biogenesis protein CcmI, partial [Nevskiaceae bacterium]